MKKFSHIYISPVARRSFDALQGCSRTSRKRKYGPRIQAAPEKLDGASKVYHGKRTVESYGKTWQPDKG